ncbi:hypothetical protein RQP46_008548 [Phenoliferia psychrophenolica]
MVDLDNTAKPAPESPAAASVEPEPELEPNRFDLLPDELMSMIGSFSLNSYPIGPTGNYSNHRVAQLQYHHLIAVSRRWHRILSHASSHFSSSKVFVAEDKAGHLLAAIEDGRSIPNNIALVLESDAETETETAVGALLRACGQNLRTLFLLTKAKDSQDTGHIPGDVIWDALRSLSLVEFHFAIFQGPVFSVPADVVAGILQCWPALTKLNLSDLKFLPATTASSHVRRTNLKALVYRVDCSDALNLLSVIILASPSLVIVGVDVFVPGGEIPSGVVDALLPISSNLVTLNLFNVNNFKILAPTLSNLKHLQLGLTTLELDADAEVSPEPLLDSLHLIPTLQMALIMISGKTKVVTPEFMVKFMEKSNPELRELTLRVSSSSTADIVNEIRKQQHDGLDELANKWLLEAMRNLLTDLESELFKLKRTEGNPTALPDWALDPASQLLLFTHDLPAILKPFTHELEAQILNVFKSCGFTHCQVSDFFTNYFTVRIWRS